MQDQYMPCAIPARAPLQSLLPHGDAPKRTTTWRKPATQGLTQAQLQQIVLEQLG